VTTDGPSDLSVAEPGITTPHNRDPLSIIEPVPTTARQRQIATFNKPTKGASTPAGMDFHGTSLTPPSGARVARRAEIVRHIGRGLTATDTVEKLPLDRHGERISTWHRNLPNPWMLH
jgi:hypothetical protein